MEKKDTDAGSEIQACHHMHLQVHALADDTLKGPMRWYTRLHCSHCSQCAAALQTLREAQDAAPASTGNVV
jgi:hypothetical protein